MPGLRPKARCIRNLTNFSDMKLMYRFDNPRFNKKALTLALPVTSPKINALINKINELDKSDKKVYSHKFKHFIYSDVRGSYGAKIVTSALITAGFRLTQQPSVSRKKGKGIVPKIPHLEIDLGTSRDRGNNFVILTGTDIFKLPVTKQMKNKIVGLRGIFNKRPENVYGDLIRIIVGDSWFKEGIDLFDVKYVHILEPQITEADKTQVIGRATRLCGQSGLKFIPNEGWKLHVFEYDTVSDSKRFGKESSMHEVMMVYGGLNLSRANLTSQLLALTQKTAIDHELNKAINDFGKPESEPEPELEELPK